MLSSGSSSSKAGMACLFVQWGVTAAERLPIQVGGLLNGLVSKMCLFLLQGVSVQTIARLSSSQRSFHVLAFAGSENLGTTLPPPESEAPVALTKPCIAGVTLCAVTPPCALWGPPGPPIPAIFSPDLPWEQFLAEVLLHGPEGRA